MQPEAREWIVLDQAHGACELLLMLMDDSPSTKSRSQGIVESTSLHD